MQRITVTLVGIMGPSSWGGILDRYSFEVKFPADLISRRREKDPAGNDADGRTAAPVNCQGPEEASSSRPLAAVLCDGRCDQAEWPAMSLACICSEYFFLRLEAS